MEKEIHKLYNSALTSYNQNNFLDAYNNLKKLLSIEPTNMNTLNLIGVVATRLNRIEEAKMYFQLIIRLDNTYINSYINLANLYQNANDFDTAKDYYLKAIAIDSNNLEAYNNLSLIYKNINNLDKSEEYALKALSIKDNAIIKYNLSLIYLSQNRYKKGFDLFRARYNETQTVDKVEILNINKLLTKNINTENKTIFIYNEQGFGDMIQFIRFLPLLKKQCKKVIVHINPLLKKLFKQNYPDIKFVSNQNNLKYDYHLPLMELGYLLNIKYKDIPFSNKYLSIDKKKSKSIYKHLFLKNDKPKVGIIWKSNSAKNNEVFFKANERNSRNISLELFLQIFKNTNLDLYSLQKDTTTEEENILRKNKIPSLGNDFISFYDNALVIDNLDLLIGIDTTAIQLSGAMGKKAFVILPFSSDWRWGIKSSKTNWYDSITLFRQKEYGKWEDTLQEVSKRLRKVTSTH